MGPLSIFWHLDSDGNNRIHSRMKHSYFNPRLSSVQDWINTVYDRVLLALTFHLLPHSISCCSVLQCYHSQNSTKTRRATSTRKAPTTTHLRCPRHSYHRLRQAGDAPKTIAYTLTPEPSATHRSPHTTRHSTTTSWLAIATPTCAQFLRSSINADIVP